MDQIRIPLPFLLALVAWTATAQTAPQSLFPGLEGKELRAAIAATYSPVTVLSEEQSKDTLYAVIDRETRDGQDGASGVYSDYFVPFDCNPSCDPSQDVYNNGSGLSQEHTWPRSEGADFGNAERDLHHLFPSKQTVNAARGNLPFGESLDASTSTWYYLAGTQTTVPPQATRDLWSERLGSTLFEPREERKGDVARAMFYFYTIYGPDGTGQANPAFWEAMQEELLDWHRADTATVADRARSDRVARYQITNSGDPAINPFAVDSSLAARAFYPEALPTSTPPGSEGVPALLVSLAGPNPVRGTVSLGITSSAPRSVQIEVYDVIGRLVAQSETEVPLGRPTVIQFSTGGWPVGAYIARITAGATSSRCTFTVLR